MKFAPLKRAAIHTMAVAGVMLVSGCDDLASADKTVETKVEQASVAFDKIDALSLRSDLEPAKAALEVAISAASEKSASPVWRATAAGVAADMSSQLANVLRSRISDSEQKIRSALADLRVLSQQVAVTNFLSAGYRGSDPKVEIAKVELLIKDIQGAGDKATWSPPKSDDASSATATLPTLTALKQQISQLEGDIASRKEQINTLTKERSDALTLAETKIAASEKAKGNESVALFTEGAQARQKAEEVALKIDLTQDQLSRLQADLDIAKGLEESNNKGIAQLQEQLAAMQAGWTDAQDRVAAQKKVAESILNGGDNVTISIANRATDLAKLMVTIGEQRREANQELERASKYYKDAVSAARDVGTDKRVTSPPPGNKRFKDLKEMVHPGRYNLPLGGVYRSQGVLAADEAALAGEIANVRALVQTALQGAELSVPTDLPSIETKQITTLVETASEKLRESNDLLISVSEGDTPKPVAEASKPSRLITLYRMIALQDLRTALGMPVDPSAAGLKSDAAQLRSDIVTNGQPLPALPGDMGTPPSRQNQGVEATDNPVSLIN